MVGGFDNAGHYAFVLSDNLKKYGMVKQIVGTEQNIVIYKSMGYWLKRDLCHLVCDMK